MPISAESPRSPRIEPGAGRRNPTAAPRRSTPVSPLPEPTVSRLDRGAITRLQALAGNQAVGWLMQDGPARSPVVQRRRVPVAGQVDPLVAPGAKDRTQHLAGLQTVLKRARAELSSVQWALVRARAVGGGGTAAFNVLTPAERDRRLADAVRALHGDHVLGSPALIDVGPRAGTADGANLAALVAGANAMLTVLVSGVRDADLQDVFGAASVSEVKSRYQRAQNQMNLLMAANRIVTDRSGYNDEVGLGGLTSPQQISLAPQVIDTPAAQESIVTMIHESMHAGVPSIDDRGYIGSPSFTTISTANKIDNAAHYEVTPRRIWGLGGRYAGVVFVPAGTTVTTGGVTHTAPALTPWEEASRTVSEMVRAAWAMGLNMHNFWVRVNQHRDEWTGIDLPTRYVGAVAHHFSDCLPFWSNVQGLTVHHRSGISTTAATLATAPVTEIDVALSEGLIRLLGNAMDIASTQLAGDVATAAFLGTHSSPVERLAATTPTSRSGLLLLTLRRAVGEITGPEKRDVKVIKRMAAAPDYGDMLVARAPGSFH